MNQNGTFYIGKTKGGDLFYKINFGNGGGGCGLLKTLKKWEAIKYRALATRKPEHVEAWENVILAAEHHTDWNKAAELEYEKMIAEALA